MDYLRVDSAKILNSFECGIQTMDFYIHTYLDSLIRQDNRFRLYVTMEKNADIVGMFVLRDSSFVDYDDAFHDIPHGEMFGYLDDDFQILKTTSYPTLRIEYLAVREDLRNQGYGMEIINIISRMAMDNECYFLTVDAYHNAEYSAIPFYEKMGFFAIEEFSDDSDTLRMAKRLA